MKKRKWNNHFCNIKCLSTFGNISRSIKSKHRIEEYHNYQSFGIFYMPRDHGIEYASKHLKKSQKFQELINEYIERDV